MGLASKLAAAQANQGGGGGAPAGSSGYGAPAQQQQMPYPGQSQGTPPPQQGARPGSVSGPLAGQQPGSIPYQNPSSPAPGASGYGARPQSGYGAPPQPPQSPYGAQSFAPPPGPPPGAGYGAPPQQQQYGQPQGGYGAPPGPPPQQGRPGGMSPQALEQTLRQCAMEQKIQAFYPPQALSAIAQQVAASGALEKVASEWRLPMEIAVDLVKLALFDTVLFIDDSGSMAFEEGGSRIDDLKLIIGRVAQVTSIFDSDGISCRFMNSREGGDGLRSEADAQGLISRIRFTGLTPFGTQLNAKVIDPMVLQPARANALKKPVLIIAVTDGQPAGEDRGMLFRVIQNANNELARSRYGPDALSIQIAQVGNDVKARQFLEEIDSHPQIGGLVDCTSNYELEADEMSRANPPVELTPELWLVKMLLGAIDDSYDKQDE